MSYLPDLCLFRTVVSNTYCVVFLFYFSCVPYVASFSGSFVIALRLVYAMLPVSPDLL